MATIIKIFIVTGESHIDFREQTVTITLGRGSITGKHSKKIILLQFLAQKKDNNNSNNNNKILGQKI